MDEQFVRDYWKDVRRGVSERDADQQRLPQARWMRLQEIMDNPGLHYDPKAPGGKILVGALGDRLIGIEDERHVLTIGGSRSGKSVGLKSNLFFYPGSVLVMDPKGEHAKDTANFRAAKGQDVHILAPFGGIPADLNTYLSGYNPMDVLTPSSPTILEDAALIADAMVASSGQERDPHWNESARNFIEGVIVHVATDAAIRDRTLMAVRDLVKTALQRAPGSPEGKPPALFEDMCRNADALNTKEATQAIGGAILGAAYDFYSKKDAEISGVLSTVNRHTKWLDYSAFRRVLNRSDLSLRDLKRSASGVSVYLCFPGTAADLSMRWMRIFVNQLLTAMEREPKRNAIPVLVCLDEFPVLGYMRQLETAAGLFAGFGVKLWTILQDWNQGVALYGKRWETFAGNAGITQFFGNNDYTTCEYFSKRMGVTSVQAATINDVKQDQRTKDGTEGFTISNQLHPLMTPDEIARAFSIHDRLNRQAVIQSGEHPMLLQQVHWYREDSPLRPYLHNDLPLS